MKITCPSYITLVYFIHTVYFNKFDVIQVVLPLVERYFRAHRNYFISNPNVPHMSGNASVKEKEMTTMLFSKLALLLRQRITAFGHDVNISVRCLQTLVQAIDARYVLKVEALLIPYSHFQKR